MSVSCWILRFGGGVAVVALTALLAGTAEAGSRQPARPIEFSQPRSLEGITNLQQFATKKDALKLLEEDLNKPLQSFMPKSSLEGVVAPTRRAPAPSALQSQRAKELLERRRDWVFMTPEDLLESPTVEQILKTPEYGLDSQEKRDLPALERYYQGLISKRPTQRNPALPEGPEWWNLARPQQPAKPETAPAREDEELPAELQERAEALRNAFSSGRTDSSSGGGTTLSSFYDPFQLAGSRLSKEQSEERNKLMDEYRTLVDPGWRPPVPNRPVPPIFGLGELTGAPQSPAVPLPTVPTPTLGKSVATLPDPANPLLGPQLLPDLNARAVGQTKSAAVATEIQPRRVIPKATDFSAPRRAF